MSKNVIQDIMPPKRRSIRDIPLRENKKNITNENPVEPPVNFPSYNEQTVTPKKGHSKIKWFVVGLVTILIFVFVFPFFFSSANVTITPKEDDVQVSANFSSSNRDNFDVNTDVAYDLISVSSEGFRTATDFQEKEVDKKASGDIVIFNDYSSASQRLVINTRFQAPNGLIYRVAKSVVVPGKTASGPGSVTVTVYADSPGAEYNIGLVDFTVPGFKGTDRFDKFYARSKTEMAGGYSGVMKIIPDDETENLREQIKADLEKELTEQIYSKIPENSIVYKDGMFLDFSFKPNVDLGDSVQVVADGTLSAIVFDKKDLSDALVSKVISGNNKMDVLNLESLAFSVKNKNIFDVNEKGPFNFSLEGLGKFVWSFDEDKMKSDFAGRSKKDTNAILAGYDGIKEAEVTISPFWKITFPSNKDKIKITRLLNENQ